MSPRIRPAASLSPGFRDHRANVEHPRRTFSLLLLARPRTELAGPFKLPDFALQGVAARTDYLVDGEHELTMVLTASPFRYSCALERRRRADVERGDRSAPGRRQLGLGYPRTVQRPDGRLVTV